MEINTTTRWSALNIKVLEELAQRYGTPFYIYDVDLVKSRIEAIKQHFDNKVEVYYAVKANPNLALLKAIKDTADGLDISSGGELEQAAVAGFKMQNLSFAGPAKNTQELTAAIESGVGCISIESIRELMECVSISRRIGKQANVALRVNPMFLNRAFGMKMGGRAVQFGIDEEFIEDVAGILSNYPENLVFQGIHVYAGSQCFAVEGVVDGVLNTFRIALDIEKNTGLSCRMLNLGGGFGVSHTEVDHELNLKELANSLKPIIRENTEKMQLDCKIVFELGRYLTADAGMYVARLISSKESRGKTFFLVDGGLHHHLAAAGTFGTALRKNFVMTNLSNPTAQNVSCNIAGPSCNPTDLLGVDVELAKPELGDLIGVMKAGSYGLTASPMLFLGRPTPAELIWRQDSFELGRKPKTILDFN